MTQGLAYFAELGVWNWFIIAVILLGLELLTPGVNLLWFGLAAVVVGILGLLTGITWQWQLVAFALMAVGVFFLVRRLSNPEQETGDSSLNNRAEQYIGRVFVVENAIKNGRGKVRVGDTLWTAQGDDVPEGGRVRVIGANGNVLAVERDRS